MSISNEPETSAYPDNNPKTVVGLTKPSISKIPPAALIHCALAMMNGAKKYGAFNWREKKVTSSIYIDAKLRHILAYMDGEDLAADSGVHHLGHDMACSAIVLDALETGNLIDDRPRKGMASEMIARYTMGLPAA